MRGEPQAQFERVPPDIVAAIRERFNVSDVARRLGFALRPSGHEFIGLCPWHRERTASWTVNDAKGFAHCFGCGAHHDTIGLLREGAGLSFRDALVWLDASALPAVDPIVRQEQERATREARLQAIADARGFFADAETVRLGEADPVSTYLAARHIFEAPPPTVRFGMVPAWQDRETKEWGPARPCMLVAAQDAGGTITGVQRVFFVQDRPELGRAEKPKRSLGSIRGSPGRLGEVARHINLAEGPEDALSVREMMPERPTWCAFGTSQMPFVGLPPEVEEVTLLGQNNEPSRVAVRKAGEALLERGLAVREAFPPAAFGDWNDVKRGVKL